MQTNSPAATSVAGAIANRAVAGNAFGTSSKRAMLCFPQESFFDAGIVPTGVTLNSSGTAVAAQYNANATSPYSQWVAGAMAARDLAKGQARMPRKPSAKRSRAASEKLKREGRAAASHLALSRHAHQAAERRKRMGR